MQQRFFWGESGLFYELWTRLYISMYDFKVCPHGAIATAIYLSQLMDYMEPTDACENITFRQLRMRAVIAVKIATCEQPFKAH